MRILIINIVLIQELKKLIYFDFINKRLKLIKEAVLIQKKLCTILR